MSHIHEKIDFTSTAFVVYKNQVLLRKHDKYGFWLGVGGHVDLDEDPNQTAVREVKEEVGLGVELWAGNKKFISADTDLHKELIPPVAMNRHHTSPDHEHIDLIYLAKAKSNAVKPEDGEQQDGWKWCTKEDLKTMDLLPDVKFYAELAIDTLGK